MQGQNELFVLSACPAFLVALLLLLVRGDGNLGVRTSDGWAQLSKRGATCPRNGSLRMITLLMSSAEVGGHSLDALGDGRRGRAESCDIMQYYMLARRASLDNAARGAILKRGGCAPGTQTERRSPSRRLVWRLPNNR